MPQAMSSTRPLLIWTIQRQSHNQLYSHSQSSESSSSYTESPFYTESSPSYCPYHWLQSYPTLSSSRSLSLTIPILIRHRHSIPSPLLALIYTRLITHSSLPSKHRTSHPKLLITILAIRFPRSGIALILRLTRCLTYRLRLDSSTSLYTFKKIIF
ncbi:hypothetical protein BT96DRAFT_310343 [Gymnopus androsaceus JB14]|uniref:Uncharacterized protein n=1 Tax=Gymnopus androsaceus JB14 TaxID=1447944 RepID=A0A6A4H0V1_9AGAR|nr:hypothetical protein BT96DRAFT_310343 [Gymnopus androsaceus JB14]